MFCCSNVDCVQELHENSGYFVVIPGCMRYTKGPRIDQLHCSKCYSYALNKEQKLFVLQTAVVLIERVIIFSTVCKQTYNTAHRGVRMETF